MDQEYWKKRRRNLRNHQEEENEKKEDEYNSNSKYYERHKGEKWEKNRRLAKIRDDNSCVICDISDEEHKKRDDLFGDGNHVHHIKPVREFDDSEEAHELQNLITVCSEHHKKLE